MGPMDGLEARGPSWPNRFRDDRDPIAAAAGYADPIDAPGGRKGTHTGRAPVSCASGP